MKKQPRALITGGAGFIGSHLSERLLADGWKVTIIDNLTTGSLSNLTKCLQHPDFSFAIDTILNETVLDRLVSECDYIFHLASAVGVKLIIEEPVNVIETNVFGTNMVLKVATRYRKRVMITSTSEVYGKANSIPFREDQDLVIGPPTKHRWIYAVTKAESEFAALSYYNKFNLSAFVVRLFNTIGPRQTGQYGMVVPTFVTQALQDKPLTVYGSGEQTRCFTNVNDIIDGITRLMQEERATGGIFNLGSSEEVSINKLAEMVIKLTGSKSSIQHIPYDEAYEAGFEDMPRRVPDTTKARELVGFSASQGLTSTLKGIIETIKSKLAAGK